VALQPLHYKDATAHATGEEVAIILRQARRYLVSDVIVQHELQHVDPVSGGTAARSIMAASPGQSCSLA